MCASIHQHIPDIIFHARNKKTTTNLNSRYFSITTIPYLFCTTALGIHIQLKALSPPYNYLEKYNSVRDTRSIKITILWEEIWWSRGKYQLVKRVESNEKEIGREERRLFCFSLKYIFTF